MAALEHTVFADVTSLWRAADAKRQAEGLTWREVASQCGVSPATLTRVGQSQVRGPTRASRLHGQTRALSVDGFARLVVWVGVSADNFIIGAPAKKRQCLPVVVAAHLGTWSEGMSPKQVRALVNIVNAAYMAFRRL